MAMTVVPDGSAKAGQAFTVPRSDHAPDPVPFDARQVAATVGEDLDAALQAWCAGPPERLAPPPRRAWTPGPVAGGRSRSGRTGRAGAAAILLVGVAGLALGAVLARLPMTRHRASHPIHVAHLAHLAHPAQPRIAATPAPTEVWPPRAPLAAPVQVAAAPPAASISAAAASGPPPSRALTKAAQPSALHSSSTQLALAHPVPSRLALSRLAPSRLAASHPASVHLAANRPASTRRAPEGLRLAARSDRRLIAVAAGLHGSQGLCGGKGAYKRTLCLNTAMREADSALRENYERAVRARVDSSTLSDYHDTWMSLRNRMNGDPEGVVRGYYQLAGQLKAATRRRAATASLAGEL